MRETSVRGAKGSPSRSRATTKSAAKKTTRPTQAAAKTNTAAKQVKTATTNKPATKNGKTAANKPTAKAATKSVSPAKKPASALKMAADKSAKAAGKSAAPPVKAKSTAKPATKPAARTEAKSAAQIAPTAAKTARPKTAASSAAQPAPTKQPSQAEALALRVFEKAHKAFTLGNFAQARDLFNELLGTFVSASEVVARARTYLNIAENRLRSAAPTPRDADALYDTGVVALNRGDLTTARDYFERALKRDPEAAHIHYVLATIYTRTGAHENALAALTKALSNNPKLRIRTMQDSDFAALRDLPDYEKLIEGN